MQYRIIGQERCCLNIQAFKNGMNVMIFAKRTVF